MDRFWSKVAKLENGCWEWARAAHRIAWELIYGPIPPGNDHHGTCVLHRCDNRACVNPDHLRLGTQQDNIADMKRKGRASRIIRPVKNRARGERSGSAKLTYVQVEEIRERYSGGNVRQKDLATEYGVSQTLISAIVRREIWRM